MGWRGHLFNLYHNSLNWILKKIIALYIQNIFEQNRCRSQLFKPLPKGKGHLRASNILYIYSQHHWLIFENSAPYQYQLKSAHFSIIGLPYLFIIFCSFTSSLWDCVPHVRFEWRWWCGLWGVRNGGHTGAPADKHGHTASGSCQHGQHLQGKEKWKLRWANLTICCIV